MRRICKDCWNKYQRERYHAKYSKDNNFKSRYNITEAEYNVILSSQLECCAICKKKCKTGRRLAVDHNHQTNEIRGLLCMRCNVTIGNLRDNEDLIWDIMEYLKRTTWNKKAVA